MRSVIIGIDMRMAGTGFGIGTYIRELVSALLARKSGVDYRLFFDSTFSRAEYESYSAIHDDCRLLDVMYYSLTEQLKLPRLLSREKLDLMHFPNFNVPIFYTRPYVVTIHDLIHHKFPGKKKKNFCYRWGYKAIIKTGARNASAVIAVSNQTKSDIGNFLGVGPEKIKVIYEGAGGAFTPGAELGKTKWKLEKFGIKKSYVLSVGVWRQYKNLPTLASAFQKLRSQGFTHQLVLVGELDKNYPEIGEAIFRYGHANSIIAPGRVSASDLLLLYQHAEVYVSPSLSEGFGLPSLEAQACGIPVLSSDIPPAKEILSDGADYFDPGDEKTLVHKLVELLRDKKLRGELAQKGLENSRRFSWAKAAEATEKLYLEILKRNIS